jgi:hypothetical protein
LRYANLNSYNGNECSARPGVPVGRELRYKAKPSHQAKEPENLLFLVGMHSLLTVALIDENLARNKRHDLPKNTPCKLINHSKEG